MTGDRLPIQSGNAESGAAPRSVFTDQSSQGALFLAIHQARHVKAYPILESELNTLTVLSGVESIAGAVFGGALAFGIEALWAKMLRTAPLEAHVQSLENLGLGVCVAVMLGASVAYGVARGKKQSLIQKMKDESPGEAARG